MTVFEVQPIGVVRSDRDAAIDDDWDAVGARVELDLDVVDGRPPTAWRDFSHVEVIFLFDQVDPATVRRGARHPRGNTAWPRSGSSPSGPRTGRTASEARCAR